MQVSFIAALPSIRPPFLLLAPICVCYGASIAVYNNQPINLSHLLLIIIGAVSALISVNCLNEYQDNASGLDANTKRTPFSGGSGLLQQQPELASMVNQIAIISLTASFIIGCYFAITIGLTIVPIGLIGSLIIFTYTRYLNKSPWLCLFAPGLGIGVLIAGGSYFVLTGELIHPYLTLLLLIPFLQINNLLLLNQYPDINADQQAGRNHFPIAYGIKKSNLLYGTSALLSVVVLILTTRYLPLPKLILLALVPMAFSFISLYGMCKYQQKIAGQIKYLTFNVLSANLTPIVIAIILFNHSTL
ncbi:hypothetical protein tinsulaeT_31560 [Thalassotalea insulae]|uniref:1,4-dihydroxy-2-naphthoate octaprenyltransferase n=1 Tax=Thalassotalea insulae TaxID=2056778 RepID=A0ABQ6GYX4_9GAMM|nr:prenyltransferase [Thalassotalea insulae]GLX79816.1 hypothetical protein tinsulaeT_31560 [Thalassotalea insulae]